MNWEEERQEKRRGRVEGIGLVLFGLSTVRLALVLFGEDVSATSISLILAGLAVTVIGTYAAVTGQRLSHRKSERRRCFRHPHSETDETRRRKRNRRSRQLLVLPD